MKVTTFAKASVSVVAAAALTCGFATSAFAASGPTADQEDAAFPTPAAATTLVGAGSDTTQDVMYGIAQAINAGKATPQIASYTATGTTVITWRSNRKSDDGKAVRPNGSGAGYKALNDSIGYTASGNYGVGDVDFARASGAQGTAVNGGNGVTTDIPFAIDAMSFAVPAGSPFLKTNGGAGLTITDLYNIYGGIDTYIDSSTGNLLTSSAAGALPINAFVPKGGSGSRQFFLAQLATQGNLIDLTAGGSTKGDGLFATAGTPTGTSSYVGAVDYAGDPVQEHDASVLTKAPSTVAAIAPFSGAKFIGYADGKIADPDAGKVAGTDYQLVPFKSSATGAPATGVLPYSGTGTSLTPNQDYVTYAKQGGSEASFAMTRDVFNIIPTAAVKFPTANPKFALLNQTFVGPTSDVCKQTAAIAAFGFFANPKCGDTSKTYDPMTQTPTVEVTAPASAVAGKPAVYNVTVTSTGNGGGTVTLTIDGKDFTGKVAAGSTTGTVSVTLPTAGTFPVTGSFVPNLGGVASAPVQADALTVAVNQAKADAQKAVTSATAAVTTAQKAATAATTAVTKANTKVKSLNKKLKKAKGAKKAKLKKQVKAAKKALNTAKAAQTKANTKLATAKANLAKAQAALAKA